MGIERRLPCGWRFRLPRFCEGRKCSDCPVLKASKAEEAERRKEDGENAGKCEGSGDHDA
jgi:hypothetical protein